MRRSSDGARAAFGASAALVLLLGSSGCSERRERREPQAPCVSWQGEVAQAFQQRCVGCHRGQAPAGDYDLSSYQGALGRGSDDTPNVIAGDLDSALLQKLDPDGADSAHRVPRELRDALRRWVGECDLAHRRSSIHPAGILNPRDPQFHGALLAELAWDFEQCTSCHGDELDGGPAESSCLSCHRQGTTDCSTCHSASLRRLGAHDAHLSEGGMTLPFDECSQCHVTPRRYEDPGHLFLDQPGGPVDPPPAEVELGARARMTLDGAPREREPRWEAETGTCRAVYCHGATLDDPAAVLTTPRWSISDSDPARCGSCHGIPPADHGQDECARCHSQVVDADDNIIDEQLHIDGITQVGPAGTEGCPRCHGSDATGAPPPDLDGRTDRSLPSVGAHRAHLQAEHQLSAKVACGACHRVPDEVQAPGHTDTELPVEVFPNAVSDTSLAFAAGADPVYNDRSARCLNVYCHGAGPMFADDAAEGLDRSPRWAGPGTIACGDCHGIPPGDETHGAISGLDSCHECHDSVDAFGNIILTGPPGARLSEHIDGEIDVR